MQLQEAAQIGEAVSGIAILFTLLFSLRQIKFWNENRRYEIGRDLANFMNTPLIHRGFAVTTLKLSEELTFEGLNALSREEKDAMNATMIGFNNIGLLAKYGHLSNDLVEAFCGYYIRIFGSRWRRAVEIHAKAMMQQPESIRMVWGGLYWLMDTLEEAPNSEKTNELAT